MNMVIDNFDKISNVMKFDNENDFYYIQLISRKKDNGISDFTVKEYSVRSVESLMKIKDEIVSLCNMFNARAYIYVNKRNYKNISLKMIKELSDIVCDENFKKCKKAFTSCCGKYSSGGENKLWIIDVDVTKCEIERHGTRSIEELVLSIIENSDDERVQKSLVDVLPTRNGFHVLIKPCDTRGLNSEFAGFMRLVPDAIKEIDIKKDAMTILYYKEPAI